MIQKKRKMRLGEILIEHGVLTEDGLYRALEIQSKEGGLLGEVLLRMGLVKEEDIVIALAQQFNYPYLPVQNCEINPKLIKLVPVALVKKFLFIPIDRIKDVLTIIMVDPTNEFARQEIQKSINMRLQVLVGTVTEITNAIRRYYKIKGSIIDSVSPTDHLSHISFHDAIAKEKGEDVDKNEKKK